MIEKLLERYNVHNISLVLNLLLYVILVFAIFLFNIDISIFFSLTGTFVISSIINLFLSRERN